LADRENRLTTIPGSVPSILDLPIGCKFETRCSVRLEKCATIEPQLIETLPGHWVRCHLVNP
jgi:oligopeptide transport system ATP-binding protein